MKLQLSLDLLGPLHALVGITSAGRSDLVCLGNLPIEPGSFYVMDCGGIDSWRPRRIV